MFEVNECATFIQDQAHDDANIIFGAVVDERMGDDLSVTVIATGFESHAELVTERPQQEMRVGPEDLDIPTHIRRNNRFAELQSVPPQSERPVAERLPVARPAAQPTQQQPVRELRSVADSELAKQLEDEELDVPTFLRRPDR